MLYNYLLVAWRNLIRQPFYSTINVVGLAIGISCFLLIMLFVGHELSYDAYHEKASRIYRLQFDGKIGDTDTQFPYAGPPVAQAMIDDFPEVENAVRFRDYGRYLVKVGEDNYKEDDVVLADPSVFDIFNIPLLSGDPATALTEPNTLILSEKLAKRYFKGADPVGQTLLLENRDQYEVTGVFKDLPENTHLNFEMVLSMASTSEANDPIWLSLNFQTYILLKEGASPEQLEAKFPDMVLKYIGPEIQQYMNASMEEFVAGGNRVAFYLFPMQDIYLHSHLLEGEFKTNGDIKYVYIFSIIGIFILLIACINFMNLATARSASRAKEVGLRKVMGAHRGYLVRQFLSESMLISFLSVLLAIALVSVVIEPFNSLAGKQFSMSDLLEPSTLLILLSTAVIVGLLAGSYPALYLSRFQPATVLKGLVTRGKNNALLRSSLVVFQFATTIILIIGTLIIYNQLNYIQQKNLGFNKEHLIMVKDAYALGKSLEPFKEQLLQNNQISDATVTSYSPVLTNSNGTAYFPGKTVEGKKTQIISYWIVDDHFASTYDFQLKEGRFFDSSIKTDTAGIILNEVAASMLFPGEENITSRDVGGYGYNSPDEGYAVYKVLGVVEDFHFESLHEPIKPMIFHMGSSRSRITFRISPQTNIEEVLSDIRIAWDELANGQPFDFEFADQRYMLQYAGEKRIAQIAIIFSGLAIFIACLGLLGLAAFTAEQRTKEIGIRKVLGANVFQVMALLSKSFGKLILVAFLLAAPLGWFFMDEWLSSFEYRAPMSWWIYPLAGVSALLVAWGTMSWTSYKAATSNPVKALRSE